MKARSLSFDLWSRTGRLAPYVTTRAVACGTITMLEVAQPAGDTSGPAIDDLVVAMVVSERLDHTCDLGHGRFAGSAPAGALSLIPPDTVTSIEAHNDHVVRTWGFPAGRCRRLLMSECSDDSLDFGRLHRQSFRHGLIEALIERLWEETGHLGAVTKLFADGAMCTILSELATLSGRKNIADGPRIGDWRIRLTIDQLEAQLGDDVGLAELADQVGLTPRHYSQLFKAATGLPPHRWLMKRRVEKATEMLADPQRSITEIAFSLGFASSQHFATVFRRFTRMTPSDYRQQRCT